MHVKNIKFLQSVLGLCGTFPRPSGRPSELLGAGQAEDAAGRDEWFLQQQLTEQCRGAPIEVPTSVGKSRSQYRDNYVRFQHSGVGGFQYSDNA